MKTIWLRPQMVPDHWQFHCVRTSNISPAFGCNGRLRSSPKIHMLHRYGHSVHDPPSPPPLAYCRQAIEVYSREENPFRTILSMYFAAIVSYQIALLIICRRAKPYVDTLCFSGRLCNRRWPPARAGVCNFADTKLVGYHFTVTVLFLLH